MLKFERVQGTEIEIIYGQLEESMMLKGYEDTEFLPEYIDTVLEQCDSDMYAVVVYDEDFLVGFSVIYISPTPLSPVLEAHHLGFYIDRLWRNKDLADTLLECTFKVAKDLGASKLNSGVSSGERVKAATRFFKQHGFEEVAPLLSKEL